MDLLNQQDTLMDVRDELSQQELNLLAQAKLLDLAPVEAWTAIGTNMQLAYSTHGIFRYFGKFPPPVAAHLIEKFTEVGDLVWDPMCGSGTTGVESLLRGRKSILCDVNPLSRLLSRVKTRFLSQEVLEQAVNRVIEGYRPCGYDEYDFLPIGLRNAEHWFLPETANSLRGLKRIIEEENNDLIKDFLLVLFASTVRIVSRATTQQGRLFLDVVTAKEDALPTFISKTKKAINAVSSLPEDAEKFVSIVDHDIQHEFPLKHQSTTKLIILHPPYFNAYRYSSVNSLELSWLGFNHNVIRKSEVRESFKVGKPEKVNEYLDDMSVSIKNACGLLVPGGRIGLMIGDTFMKGSYIPVTRMLLDTIPSDIKIEQVALRVPKYTEATWVASQRRDGTAIGVNLYDFIITLRKC